MINSAVMWWVLHTVLVFQLYHFEERRYLGTQKCSKLLCKQSLNRLEHFKSPNRDKWEALCCQAETWLTPNWLVIGVEPLTGSWAAEGHGQTGLLLLPFEQWLTGVDGSQNLMWESLVSAGTAPRSLVTILTGLFNFRNLKSVGWALVGWRDARCSLVMAVSVQAFLKLTSSNKAHPGTEQHANVSISSWSTSFHSFSSWGFLWSLPSR